MLITDVMNNAGVYTDSTKKDVMYLEMLYPDVAIKVKFFNDITSEQHIDDYETSSVQERQEDPLFVRVVILFTWFYNGLVR